MRTLHYVGLCQRRLGERGFAYISLKVYSYISAMPAVPLNFILCNIEGSHTHSPVVFVSLGELSELRFELLAAATPADSIAAVPHQHPTTSSPQPAPHNQHPTTSTPQPIARHPRDEIIASPPAAHHGASNCTSTTCLGSVGMATLQRPSPNHVLAHRPSCGCRPWQPGGRSRPRMARDASNSRADALLRKESVALVTTPPGSKILFSVLILIISWMIAAHRRSQRLAAALGMISPAGDTPSRKTIGSRRLRSP